MSLKKSKNNITFSYPTRLIGGKYIVIGDEFFAGPNGILSAWDFSYEIRKRPNIVIGDRVTIGNGFHISAVDKISIGSDVLFGKYVTIVDNSHGQISVEEMRNPPMKRNIFTKGEVVIEDRVWIGDKVTICQNVRIGEGSIIGSNSVVTKNIPPFSVAAGVPAKVIKQFNI